MEQPSLLTFIHSFDGGFRVAERFSVDVVV